MNAIVKIERENEPLASFAARVPFQTPERDDREFNRSVLPSIRRDTQYKTANRPAKNISAGQAKQPATAAIAAQTGIDGVVVDVKSDAIAIQCRVGNEDVELNLPPAVVPEQLQKLGQPVVISLDRSLGYQRPLVRARAPAAREKLQGEDDVDAWLATL